MALKTTPFVPGHYILTPEDAIAFIEGAIEEVGPEHMKPVLRAVAESVGMTALAERSGLTRAGLYRALSEEGDPKLSTLTAILEALGLRLSVVPKDAA
ncbi:MAG: putative addiction module antidote protein [Hyphomonas sp.]|nr:putative addiction module antidote protein [Hyphomonas sp.]MDP3459104.1 putative addiction module antidote protein [Hyphomonas sp.]